MMLLVTFSSKNSTFSVNTMTFWKLTSMEKMKRSISLGGD